MRELSPKELESFALGIDDTEWRDGCMHVHRAPRALRPVYSDTEPRRVRLACTAGARVRFRSETRALEVGLRFGRTARELRRGVVVIDHAVQIPFGPDERCARWAGSVELGNRATMRTIDLWLPHVAECCIERVAVDAGASIVTAPPPALRWIAYCDSITQGMEATLPTRTWVARCTLSLDANVLDVGIGGATLEPTLAVDSDYGADLITITFGVNDFARNVPPGNVADHGRKLLAVLRSASESSIVVITPLPWIGRERNDVGHHLETYCDALRSLAASHDGVTMVEGATLVSSDLRYLPDSVHPNDAGFEMMAERILPALCDGLRRGRADATYGPPANQSAPAVPPAGRVNDLPDLLASTWHSTSEH